MTCIRSAFVPGLVSAALVLAGCASDDSGVRAFNETTTLRTQLDDMRQRQDTSSREITRLQSQVRALETDAVDKTRDVKAANVELARARVLLEEARGMLREREAAAATTSAAERPTAMAPLAVARPSAPDTGSVAPSSVALPAPSAVPVTPTPPVKRAAPRPVAPDPRAIPDSAKTAPEAKPSSDVKPAPEVKPSSDVKAAPETKPAPDRAPTPKAASEPKAVAPEGKTPASEPKPVVAPSAAVKPVARPVSAPAPTAEKLFSAAMANFRVQEHGQAVLELTDLLTRYPSHSLASAAQLWIGEAYYQQRDYQQALIELRRVSEAYPRSPHVADALLKTGLCQRALGDRSAATAAWEQVVRDHPGSAAAGQARTLLGGRDSAARGTP